MSDRLENRVPNPNPNPNPNPDEDVDATALEEIPRHPASAAVSVSFSISPVHTQNVDQSTDNNIMITDNILLFSSLHGRERRIQRDITKRDFKSAIKYGQKEKVFRRSEGDIQVIRWRIRYLHVIYITDESMTIEVTSYAEELPLLKALVPLYYDTKYNEAKRRITSNKSMITSHLVFIVDMSASMDKSDMNGHRTRSRGVYYNIAEEYVADRLNPINSGVINGKGVSFTDVITLIEMRERPTVVFECEPVRYRNYYMYCLILFDCPTIYLSIYLYLFFSRGLSFLSLNYLKLDVI